MNEVPELTTSSLHSPDPFHRLQETYLRLGLESARMVLWELDPASGRFLYSANLPNLLQGADPEPFLHLDSLLRLVHPEDREVLSGTAARCLTQGKPESFDYRVRLDDSSWRWLSVSLERAPAAVAGTHCLVGVTIDVTSQRESEEGLRASEERFRELAERIESVFWVIDPEARRLVYLSPAYERIWRRPRAAAYQSACSFLDAVHPDDRDRASAARCGDSLSSGTPFEVEYRILWPDGSTRWIRDRGFPILDPHGRLTRIIGVANDVTERIAAFEALREREEIFSSIVAQAGDAIALIDGDNGSFVEFNSASHEALGYSRDEFARLTIGDIQADHSAETIRANIDAMRHLGGLTFESRHRRKDGELRNVRVSARPLEIHGRRFLAAVWGDITDRIRAEHALARRSVLLATQQEAALDGILAVDEYDRIISFNSRFLEMWGIPAELAAAGEDQHLLSCVASRVSDPERFLSRVRHLYNHRQESGQDEITLCDGSVFERHTAPMFSPDGEYFGRVWYFRDITRRRRAEAALQQSELKYRGIFDESVTPILVFDPTFRIVDVNQAGTDLLGYSRSELLALDALSLTLGEGALSAAMRDLLASGRLVNSEFHLRHKDGHSLTVLANSKLLRDDSGNPTGVLCTLSDITTLREAEQTRRTLESQLRHAQKLESIGRLAGGVAHDFNNILTIINGYSELLLRGLSRDHQAAPMLSQIRLAGKRATELTSQLLAFSRRQIIEPRPVDIADLINGSLAMLRRLVGEDVEIVNCSSPHPGMVLADPGSIHQILMNLLANARDAMPAGGRVTLRCWGEDFDTGSPPPYAGAHHGRYVLLEVSDTGHGMTEDIRLQAFDPFFTTKPEGQGTGLGLATVYGIVRQAGGWIHISSQPGDGATFLIGLPAFTVESDTNSTASSKYEHLEGGETILVVEDQDDVRRFTLAALHSYRYRTLQARSGADALRLVRETREPIHLLLTDVIMPGMTGAQLATQLTALRPSIRTLFMSGYTSDVLTRTGLDASGAGYISKPFTPEDLARRIRSVLHDQASARLLVADSDPALLSLFSSILTSAGYQVAIAHSAAELSALLESGPYHLALVDLQLPGPASEELFRSLRQSHPALRLVASASALHSPSASPSAGADALLRKPINPDQLVDAIRSLLG